jgi:pantetheine-phosphate adenylyltransferase
MATIVRDVVSHGGDISMFIPKALDINEFKI